MCKLLFQKKYLGKLYANFCSAQALLKILRRTINKTELPIILAVALNEFSHGL
ncbi:hypothetical protein JCM19302_483 [Jejuia pallidilutea]|uniref:Uncharacterized protein n=1 Tax=Jejuia pallidilutea TaxID=504487 RepID=A0A090W8L9_9FLAO|nr:hypothetical protein JCM19302_483 [Jejuia pallidilutea]